MGKDIVLILGIGLVILAVVGLVRTPHFEVGVRSTRKRMLLLGVGGLALVVAFFSGELATLYRSLFQVVTTPVVLIEPVETSSLSHDAKYVGDKIHRNLAEFLNNAGHRVIAPPLSVASNSPENNISKVFSIKLTPDGGDLAIHVALTGGDGSLIASTELMGPLSEFKEIYKVLPEAILFGLDVDERTLVTKHSAKRPTTSIEAFAQYLNARRKLGSGDVEASRAALERAIVLDKKFAMAYWSLGTLMAEQGKTSKARNFFEEADRLDPDHPKIPLKTLSQKSSPVPNLIAAVRASEAQELEPGFIFRKAISQDYGAQILIWFVDPARFNIGVVEQKDPHGFNVSDLLEDAKAVLAVNGGFFDIDESKRLSPAGVLVVNGIIRNTSPNRQSGALVQRHGDIKIIWAKDLQALPIYNFVLQTGPILVEGPDQLGIKRNDYDRLNRAAVCARGSAIVFVIVHGSHGNGLSLYEFAELLAAREVDGGAGCHIALNLDGGPSTQVAMNMRGVREKVDGLWKIANAIVVTKK